MAKPKPLRCDRCGEELRQEDEGWRRVTRRVHALQLTGFSDGASKFLCPDCAELLKEWLEGK